MHTAMPGSDLTNIPLAHSEFTVISAGSVILKARNFEEIGRNEDTSPPVNCAGFQVLSWLCMLYTTQLVRECCLGFLK